MRVQRRSGNSMSAFERAARHSKSRIALNLVSFAVCGHTLLVLDDSR